MKYIIWKWIVMTASRKQTGHIFCIFGACLRCKKFWENFVLLHPMSYNKFNLNLILKGGYFFLIFEFYLFFIQQVLISCLFYPHQCIHVNPNHPIHPPTTPIPHHFPSWCPYVCSLHLCLYFCPANRFICTIFLGSTYMREYTIFVFLFLTSFTLYDSL